jgi:hypothetical protein
MIMFRVRYMTAPGMPHVYCRVFVAGEGGGQFASTGNLTMRRSEFEAFRKAFKDAEFILEEEAHG